MTPWGTPEEIERRRRIRVSAWAYAYEMMDHSLVSDALFDSEAALIDPSMSTGHKVIDAFFREHFVAYSGQWVRKHPEQRKLLALCQRLISYQKDKSQCSESIQRG